MPLPWPKVEWKAGIFLAIIPFLLSFVIFFYPPIATDPNLQSLRFLIGIPLLVSPLLFPLFLWSWRTINVAIMRLRLYPVVYAGGQRSNEQIEQLRREYYALAVVSNSSNIYEISRAAYIQGKLYISIAKKRSRRVSEGETFAVLHKDDGLLMGLFEVKEIRENDVYALGVSNVDPLWLGYIIQRGEAEINPSLLAIYVPRGETI